MIGFGRGVCDHPTLSAEREWLVTNGIGGFASGTVAGALTRRYHGVLVAALNPPLGRTMLVASVDATATYNGQPYPLYSHHMIDAPGTLTPEGYQHINRFTIDGTVPTWKYTIADALLEKRVWMTYGENTTYVQYTLVRGSLPLDLLLRALVNHRDFHGNTDADKLALNVTALDDGVRVAGDDHTPFYLRRCEANTTCTPHQRWMRGYHMAVEAYREQDEVDDHLYVAQFTAQLHAGQTMTLVFSTEPDASTDADAVLTAVHLREGVLKQKAALPDAAPAWVQHLPLAADQFIVKRQAADNPDGRSVIAGYHWFGDWGRDTMIALPGLTLSTGRADEGATILRTFAQFVEQGMLPNRFPDYGDTPEYNTIDATLWYFEAIRAYHAATNDDALIRDLFPVLQDIVDWHHKGTYYDIQVDPVDGLLRGGVQGVQLTWMDAKVDGWVVTPRIGKPVEINALWYNALRSMAAFADLLGEDPVPYQTQADQVYTSFDRYWNAARGYCFDVLDTPLGDDPVLRPNQLFAVSLHYPVLTGDRAQAVVDVCAQHLFTPHGMRSLAPHEDDYVPLYGGSLLARDVAYHQGTTWGWVIGAFVEAHLRVYGDKALARSYLAAFETHLNQQCVGNLAEIFDADAPFTPRGAAAQAWSVAEVLRTWRLTE
jgi:predicted glycogen debranching enzyme